MHFKKLLGLVRDWKGLSANLTEEDVQMALMKYAQYPGWQGV
jgi:hypothetical protein